MRDEFPHMMGADLTTGYIPCASRPRRSVVMADGAE